MPRLSANVSFLWPDRPFLDRIDAAAAAGFRAVECHWPYDLPAARIADRLRGNGVGMVVVNTPAGDLGRGKYGLGALPGREREFDDATDLALGYARALDCPAVHCMAGIVSGLDRDAARATYVGNLRRAAAKADRAGVSLLVEPLNGRDRPGYLIGDAEEAARIMDEVRAPNLWLMFDAYHVEIASGDATARLRRLMPRTGHIQVASVPDRAEPDRGELDHGRLLAEIDRLGWTGWVGAEYRPRGDTDAGLGWAAPFGIRARPAF